MHRNSQRRYYGEGVYFLTCNTKERYPYFEEKALYDVWVEELKIVKDLKKLELYAFCLNYDHFHLLLQPDERVANISEIMRSFKSNFSRNANRVLGYTRPKVGEVTGPRLQESEKTYIKDLRKKMILHHDIPKFQRQSSFHDHVIRDEKDYKHHFFYTKDNYLHHTLLRDWIYHSGHEKREDMLDSLLL